MLCMHSKTRAGGATDADRPPQTTATSGDEQVVLDVIAAVQARDRERLFSLYHDDIEFHEAPTLPYGGATRGKQVLREQLNRAPESTWLGTWGPLQPTEREREMDQRVVAARGGEVVVEYRLRALAPSGERFDAPVLGLYRLRDGKLIRAQMFHFDTAAILGFLQRAGRRPAAA
jgi:ketosteroid isomerase-like protein